MGGRTEDLAESPPRGDGDGGGHSFTVGWGAGCDLGAEDWDILYVAGFVEAR